MGKSLHDDNYAMIAGADREREVDRAGGRERDREMERERKTQRGGERERIPTSQDKSPRAGRVFYILRVNEIRRMISLKSN